MFLLLGILFSRPLWAAAPPESEIVPIPAGTLAMGADDSAPAEAPVHRVNVSAFMIDRFEVTNQEFAAFVEALDYVTDAERHGWGWHWTGRWHRLPKANWRAPQGPGSSIVGRADHPVVQVSWHDARAYCHWRGKRLPTEAEWERAARGPGNRRYAWGDAPPREAGVFRASYGSDHCCAADAADGFLTTAPAGSFPEGRSIEGVDDLTGNVWEWMEDGYDPGFYARSPANDPLNHDPTLMKVIRGGGWGNDSEGLRATLRHANPPHYGLSMVGIRCAK